MNPGSAIDLMWRDVVELSSNGVAGQLALALFVLLPVAAIALVVRGHRGAWVSLAITGGLCLGWLLYYTTGWWRPLGAGTVFSVGGMGVVIGWLILGWQVAVRRPADAG